jgi:hypothetical protein
MKQPADLQQLRDAHSALLRLERDTRDPYGKRSYRMIINETRTRAEVTQYLARKWGCEDCAKAFIADAVILHKTGTSLEELDVRYLVPAANVYIVRPSGDSDLIKCYIPQSLDPTGTRRSARAVTWYSELGGGTWVNLPYGDNWVTAAENLYWDMKKRYGNPHRKGKIKVRFAFVPSPLYEETGETAWEVST